MLIPLMTDAEYRRQLRLIAVRYADVYADVLLTHDHQCLKVQFAEFLLEEAGWTVGDYLRDWLKGTLHA